MNDVPVLDKEMSTTGKNLSDSIVEKYAFVFQSCDVDMKLLVENKVSHYPTSDVLLKKARFLYRNQEIGWIEALAAFQEKHGDCLALDGKDAAKALEKAFAGGWERNRTICKQYTRGGRMKKEPNCLTGWIVFL